MLLTLRKSVYKNGYLLILAAWLFSLSFIFTNYWSFTSSPERVKSKFETYIRSGEQKFEDFSGDSAVLKTLLRHTAKPRKSLVYVNDPVSLFVYTANDVGNLLLTFWNTNEVLPVARDLQRPPGKYFVVYDNGEFELVIKKFELQQRQVVTVALIPIRWNYFIENNYLRTSFEGVGNDGDHYELTRDGSGLIIHNGDGKPLFGLKEKKRSMAAERMGLSLFFKILAICFVLIFVNVIATEVAHQKGWLKGFSFLAITIFILRFLSYLLPFPFDFRKIELFDPLIYAYDYRFNPSLGDLLINILLIFWMVSFVKLPAIQHIRALQVYTRRKAWLVLLASSFTLIILAFGAAGIVRSLIVDSKISFDVANFFSLTIYTLLSFIILCMVVLSFFNLSHLLLLLISKCRDIPMYSKYLVIAIAGLIYLTINMDSQALISNLLVLVWLLLYMGIMEYRRRDMFIPFMRSSFFLLWLIFFAASISALIIYQNRNNEFEQRKRKAEKLAIQADPTGENIMRIGIMNFNNFFLSANFSRLETPIDNRLIKDSLINENFSGYLNKYDTRIYTFDTLHQPLYNEDPLSYEVINNIIANQSKKTSIDDVFYYESGYDRFSYIYRREVADTSGKALGYFFVLANPKRYKSEAVYPELFKQVKDIYYDLDVNYAYAVYHRGNIISNFGDYNFVSKIAREDVPKQEYVEKKKDNNNELWYNAGNNKLVIIVKSGSVFFEAITLFAYLFGSFLFIVIFFQAGRMLLRSRFRWKYLKTGFKFNIRTQIHSTIIFISVFSFLVIGAATISFYINRFNKTNRERLVKAIQIMSNEIKSQIISHAIADDVVKIYDEGANSELERTVNEISEIHSVDVNFYDLNGNLKVSTQPYIYQKKILSEMMEPMAYYKLHYNNEIQLIQDERVGRFSYISIYVPVRDEQGQAYAYLNIPYLSSQRELNQEISNFLVTLINLNAFIFVLAGAIALLLTNRITNSFTLISSKMKDINLRKANEEIVWNTNDEIGALVNEYNKMVKKLEESAQALAKSEREGAWREMARQVAHEIKNPLTPMKLSIQYLQKSIEERHPNIESLSQRVATTLVEQIDQLSKIASDFSQFANISQVKTEVFDVSEVINSLVNLYASNEQLQITWKRLPQPAFINADRTQMNRLFTNLMLNAIEASSAEGLIPITISQQVDANKLLVKITDQGMGIPLEKRDKIFTPNFTTKTSGTGLGLAISKGIVENANGKIWFETAEGKGTTFFVLLHIVGFPA